MQNGEFSPGDRCECYRVLRLIAAGGMGDVYEAVHEATGLPVALKCLKVRHRLKDDARARMKMEAVVLSELRHANLVQVYDAGVHDDGMLWIAMELLRGQTLRELLHVSGPFPVPEALYYACEIADGVDAVHAVDVVHRDLKPENVFVTESNQVKVLDLGTGKFSGYGMNSTDHMKVVGTTAYMSPEQIKGIRVDARADVYALGLIVYEMIAGRHALAALDGDMPESFEKMALRQLEMEPASLLEVVPELAPYVAAVVTRAIQKKRELRYPNMSEFARELRAARKRFIAENRPAGADGARLTPVEGLREKLGTQIPEDAPLKAPSARPPPPRQASDLSLSAGAPFSRFGSQGAAGHPLDASTSSSSASVRIVRGRVVDASAGARSMGQSGAHTTEDSAAWARTQEAQAPMFTDVGETPVPAPYHPTEAISREEALRLAVLDQDPAFRASLRRRGGSLPEPAELPVHQRTTHTNPLALAHPSPTELLGRAHPPDTPSAGGRPRPASWLAYAGTVARSRFVLRRLALTLGLGVLIGAPPAVLGVWWALHARAQPAASALAAVSAQPAASALAEPSALPEGSASAASLAPVTAAASPASAAPVAAAASPASAAPVAAAASPASALAVAPVPVAASRPGGGKRKPAATLAAPDWKAIAAELHAGAKGTTAGAGSKAIP